MVDGRKIRAMREEAQLTAAELGERVYVGHSMIVQIERGYKKPSVELLKRIADYFGVTMEDLLVKEVV